MSVKHTCICQTLLSVKHFCLSNTLVCQTHLHLSNTFVCQTHLSVKHTSCLSNTLVCQTHFLSVKHMIFISIVTLFLVIYLLSPRKQLLGKFNKLNSYALITGASQGIGRSFCLKLSKFNFNIIAVARNKDALDSLKNEIKSNHPNLDVVVIIFDFATQDISILNKKLEQYQISLLVNNVAINHSIPTPFLEESQSLIHDIINVNITATVDLTRFVLNTFIFTKKSRNTSIHIK